MTDCLDSRIVLGRLVFYYFVTYGCINDNERSSIISHSHLQIMITVYLKIINLIKYVGLFKLYNYTASMTRAGIQHPHSTDSRRVLHQQRVVNVFMIYLCSILATDTKMSEARIWIIVISNNINKIVQMRRVQNKQILSSTFYGDKCQLPIQRNRNI